MYIVNTSFFVSPGRAGEWERFVKEKYVPMLEQNGYNARLMRALGEDPSPEGLTYCLMVEIPGMEHYNRLAGPLFDEYRTIAGPLFGDSVQFFTTLLKNCQ